MKNIFLTCILFFLLISCDWHKTTTATSGTAGLIITRSDTSIRVIVGPNVNVNTIVLSAREKKSGVATDSNGMLLHGVNYFNDSTYFGLIKHRDGGGMQFYRAIEDKGQKGWSYAVNSQGQIARAMLIENGLPICMRFYDLDKGTIDSVITYDSKNSVRIIEYYSIVKKSRRTYVK